MDCCRLFVYTVSWFSLFCFVCLFVVVVVVVVVVFLIVLYTFVDPIVFIIKQ